MIIHLRVDVVWIAFRAPRIRDRARQIPAIGMHQHPRFAIGRIAQQGMAAAPSIHAVVVGLRDRNTVEAERFADGLSRKLRRGVTRAGLVEDRRVAGRIAGFHAQFQIFGVNSLRHFLFFEVLEFQVSTNIQAAVG